MSPFSAEKSGYQNICVTQGNGSGPPCGQRGPAWGAWVARGKGRELLGVLPPAGTGALGSLHGALSWERGGESQKCEGLAGSSVQGPGAAKAGRAASGKSSSRM